MSREMRDAFTNWNETYIGVSEDDSHIKAKHSLFNIDVYINYLLCGIIALFGTVNNVVNMVIFYRLGLKDSMSVGLMALSLTDFLTSFVGISGIAYIIVDRFVPESIIEPLSINHVSVGWLRDLLFLCSTWVTTFLAVERCVCVIYPFKVKEIFTRWRCLVMVVLVYIVIISVHIPIFMSQGLVWTKVETEWGNSTMLLDRLVVKYAANRHQTLLIIDVITGAIIPLPSQILILISVIWMIHGLRMYSRIRNHLMEGGEQSGNIKSKLSTKEAKLVKVVLLLTFLQTICNCQRLLAVYAKQIFPELAFGNKRGHIHVFLWNLVMWSININSVVTIFVYLAVNSSFRVQFKEIFRINAPAL